jgi:anti-sigma factor RsiW
MSDSRMPPQETPISTTGGGQHTAPEDLTLYAMQLLPAEQAEVVERHATQCPACHEELGRIHGDLAALALTAEPTSPAAAARDRLLAQVAREKKIIPASFSKSAAQTEQKQAPVTAPRPLADFGRGKGSTLVPEPVVIPSRRPPMIGWTGWAVAATLAIVSAFLFKDHRALQENMAVQSSEMQRLNNRAAASHQLMDALTDPQAVRVTLAPKAPPKGPVAGVTYNPKRGTLVFLASNLDPLQTYKTYELWVIPKGNPPIPAGTFHPDEHGNASVIMPNLPEGVDAKAFGVTIEDAGGSDKPTMPIIMAGS